MPEIEIALKLAHHAQTLTGAEAYCMRAFAEALEVCGACFDSLHCLNVSQVIPFTLAENAGLNPISTVTELRSRHKAGEVSAGINVRKVRGWHAAVLWIEASCFPGHHHQHPRGERGAAAAGVDQRHHPGCRDRAQSHEDRRHCQHSIGACLVWS